MARRRRNHTATFKAKVVLARVRGEKILAELAEHFDVHHNQIHGEGAAGVFGEPVKDDPAKTVDVKALHVKIGELALDNEFLEVRSPRRVG